MTKSLEFRQQLQKRMLEINTYQSHSLFKEARIRCKELAAIIRENDAIPNKKALLIQLSRKVKDIDAEVQAFAKFSAAVEMSPRQQKVVRRLFTTGNRGPASAAFEAATALLVFGQRAAAMTAFSALLDGEKHRVAAAKSIIRCHLGNGHPQQAVNQYLGWLKEDRLPPELLEAVRGFLQAVLKKKGINKQLPRPVIVEDLDLDLDPQAAADDYLSVILPYVDKHFHKKQIMLEVNFQRGNMINCIVAKHNAAKIGFLRTGMVLPGVQVNRTNMISFCSVRLSMVTTIVIGRLKGDTTITMEVLHETEPVS